jgi:hypothetical protein
MVVGSQIAECGLKYVMHSPNGQHGGMQNEKPLMIQKDQFPPQFHAYFRGNSAFFTRKSRKIYFVALFSYCRVELEYQDKGGALACLTKAPRLFFLLLRFSGRWLLILDKTLFETALFHY